VGSLATIALLLGAFAIFYRRSVRIGDTARRLAADNGRLLDASRTEAVTDVRSSHERYDGDGYPDHLGGAKIPLGARIIAVCDAYSAMTTPRPYRGIMTREAALAELQRCSGSQFDPGVVRAFAALGAQSPAPARLAA
jgi:HD-GYP domain-containing protein (c-di-GMP phosphodiesterase class II)